MTEVIEMKNCERDLLRLIAEQKTASRDKQSSFNPKIRAMRDKRNDWYDRYVKSMYDAHVQDDIKSMKDLLGHNPA